MHALKGERFNSISHLIGAILALAGGAVLVTFAAMDGDAGKIVSFSIYGFTLFLLYLVSSFYHGLAGPAKQVLQRLDHQAIYLLIAGTYMPFMLVGSGEVWVGGSLAASGVWQYSGWCWTRCRAKERGWCRSLSIW